MDIKSNLKIDENRIYLTGLSMGGRGTFIVAAGLPQIFAAIMPLSPHHGPFSYVPLAEKVFISPPGSITVPTTKPLSFLLLKKWLIN